jgi:glycosyltransferase involved in cell wall biosynthesis
MSAFLRGDRLRLAFLSTYRPAQCGIATFTEDLRRATTGEHGVIAVQNEPSITPPEVSFSISKQARSDYRQAAGLANIRFDGVSIQHEYGIFGGPDGEFVLDFVEALRIPCIATFHTVLPSPSENQRRILRELGNRCDRVMVMSDLAVQLLSSVYGVQASKVVVIPHGVPNPERVPPALELARFKKEQTLLTFGLLSPGKGIETAIRAVAALQNDFPDIQYVILGATHPELKRREGERYRESLQSLVRELGAESRVTFIDQFTRKEHLCRFLAGAGVYVTPYLGKDQIVSGTLAYAVAFGLPVVSTPFAYATDLAEKNAAVLFPFGDDQSLADRLRDLFTRSTLRKNLSEAAFRLGKTMRWPIVGTALAHEFEIARRLSRPLLHVEPNPVATVNLNTRHESFANAGGTRRAS